MNKLKIFFCLLFAAVVVVGCSDQILPDPDKPDIFEGDGDGFFMSLDVLMPNGAGAYSRSHTTEGGGSSGGTEIGQDEENNVTSALIVLARRSNYGFIAAGEVRSNNLTPTNVTAGANNEKAYRALTRIYKTNLASYYELVDNPNVNPEVLVFVFCNPTKQLTDMFKGDRTPFNSTSWINTAARVTQGLQDATDYNIGIWGSNSFLMNNVELTTRLLPKNLAEWENFNKSDNPFHLSAPNATDTNKELPNNGGVADGGNGGPVRVERSVARFDFKDGSPLGQRMYNVLYHAHDGIAQNGENGTNLEPLVAVQLEKMCLVNMSNSFYYIPRVSNDGLLPGGTDADGNPTGQGYAICGFEKPATYNDLTGSYTGGNYVVGPYAKYFEGDVEEKFSEYFNYPFFEDNGEFNVESSTAARWDVYKIEDVLSNGLKDNYNGTNNYNRWRYVVENVIPGGPGNQVNGISTGIVFKARILGTDYAMTNAVNDAVEPWERNTYSQIANCLNGKPYIQTDGSTHPAITGNSTDDPIIYYLDGKLFLTWRHIRQAAIQASVTLNDLAVNGVEINRSNSLYRAVFGDGGIPAGNVYMNGTTVVQFTDPDFDNRKAAYAKSPDAMWEAWVAAGKPISNSTSKFDVPETLAAFREAATDAGIAIYQSSVDADYGPGYYCYYFYWNRHNNNNLDGVMGPMEFDVVRNNVYKLSVDKISRLGHPRIPFNDPEDPTPGTPDETDEIYLDVTVEIVPWAVRVNSITF
ncbi:MAG: Mfa1 fimbrilin C-terminal domain-containing protein [Paramuribaculum sp.]|nr:Mfa1 fimbrilin C-terminal domain-containing protein [Paramuribaculum sp.]